MVHVFWAILPISSKEKNVNIEQIRQLAAAAAATTAKAIALAEVARVMAHQVS